MKGIIRFTKMEGGGNDFIVIEDLHSRLGNSYSTLAKNLCDRKYSVGADGILVIKKSRKADIKMKYYNSDGSVANFCGNGARCVSFYAYTKKMVAKKFTLESDAGPVNVNIKKKSVKLGMGQPQGYTQNLQIETGGRKWGVDFVNTGVPHAVVFLDNYKNIDVKGLGSKIRFHSCFKPAGANVNFAVVKDKHNLLVRTYERGVEAETLACGTGSVATAMAAAYRGYCWSPVKCETTGGEILTVYFKANSGPHSLKDVALEGPAKITFEGEVRI